MKTRIKVLLLLSCLALGLFTPVGGVIKSAEAADEFLAYEAYQMALEYMEDSGKNMDNYPKHTVVARNSESYSVVFNTSTNPFRLIDDDTYAGYPYVIFTSLTLRVFADGTVQDLGGASLLIPGVESVLWSNTPVTYGYSDVLMRAADTKPLRPDNYYDTNIEFTMNITEVNVSVPLGITCLIDPNEEDAFIYGDLSIINNSYAPVKIAVNVFEAIETDKSMLLPDGLFDINENLTWGGLNEEQSKKYYSVGIFAEEEKNWCEVLSETPGYAGCIAEKYPVGVIKAKENAILSMEAHHGYSFKEAAALNLRIGFIAELCIE